MTLIDASIQNPEQRKALKDMFKEIYFEKLVNTIQEANRETATLLCYAFVGFNQIVIIRHP